MSFMTCLIVLLGGAVGTLARYVVSVLTLAISRELPWGTIIVNVTGSFVIGLFGTLTLAQGRFPLSENVRLFVMVGFCGGYTTFSSFSLQTLDLLRSGAIVRAGINIGASVALCVAGVALGHALAAKLNDGMVQIAQIAIEEEGLSAGRGAASPDSSKAGVSAAAFRRPDSDG
jgi:CrcB protein